MDSVYSILFFIFFAFGVLLVVAGVIYLIVKLVRVKDKTEKPLTISVNLLFKIYLYVVSFITLVIAVYGGSLLIKSGASYAFGIPFSYDLYAVTSEGSIVKDPTMDSYITDCYYGKSTTISNQNVCFDENTRKQDLINGATFFVSMLLIFGVHQFALRRLEKKSVTPWLKKAYTFISLFVYSIVSIVIIPTSIYQLANHLLYRVNDITISGAPGTAIGILILVLPLWIYFLVRTTKMKE